VAVKAADASTLGTDEFMGTAFHEIGHNLSLNHGGNEIQDWKPNYVSVMNNSLRGVAFSTFKVTGEFRDLNFSFQSNDLDETNLHESDGLTSVSQLVTAYWLGGVAFHAHTNNGTITKNATYLNVGGCTLDPNDPLNGTPGCAGSSALTPTVIHRFGTAPAKLKGFNDWQNAHFAIDKNIVNRLPAVHYTAALNPEVGSLKNIADSGDTDGDGVKDVKDNCPAKANADQKDTDKNGVGDVCQCAAIAAAPAAANGLKVQYRAGDPTLPSDNQIKPQIKVFNTGKFPVGFKDITVRYWYTNEGTSAQTFAVDFAPGVGVANVTSKFVRPNLLASGSNSYLEIGFLEAAGTLAPGADSGEIQTRFSRTDFTNYVEGDDYSHGTQTSYIDWTKVTVYQAGRLVWGKEPTPNYCTGGPVTTTPELKVQYRVGDPGLPNDIHMRPVIEIVNQGANIIPLSELTARYWYTQSGTATQLFSVDFAAIGASHVSGSFVTLSPVRTGANRYLQVAFNSTSPSLIAGANSGELQLHLQQSNSGAFAESDDYSYSAPKTTLTDWTHVTLYRNGVLVWGTEP